MGILSSKRVAQASSKLKPMFLGSDRSPMAYDYYFMRVEKDYYYHYTYKDRANEILEDGYLRPNFYADQPGAQGVFAISGSYGQEVTRLQVSGSRKDHMEKIVALKFKTRTEPKYGYPEEVIWDKPVKLVRPEIVSFSEAVEDLRKNEDLGENFKVVYDFKKAVEIKKEYGQSISRVAHRYLESAKLSEEGKERIKKKAHNPLDINFESTGYKKLDLAFALTYGNQDGLIKLLPKGFIDECKAEIITDTHAMFQKKRNVSPERQVGDYIEHIIPHSQWSYQWKSDFPRLNIFHEEWGKNQSLGKPPLPNLSNLEIGGEFKVDMEGANPHITGIVSVIFSILYVVVRDQVLHVRTLPKKEKFQMDFPVEINLRNSKSFDSLYLMWLEGSFR